MHDVYAVKNLRHVLGCESPDLFREKGPIKSNDLRNIRHRILGQTRRLGGKEGIAGSSGPNDVARKGHAHHRRDPTPIQGVSLDDHDRPAKSRTRPGRFRQVSPPDFPLADVYHSTLVRTRRAARATNGSESGLPSCSTTAFMSSVTSSGA